jgi:glycosyltransferase involved in cell wall biosynthesis
MPQVSIIVPTYNRADTILRAIKSIQAQTFQDWELIVVDDGSKDSTAPLVAGLDRRMILIRQQNRGLAATRITGLLASTGEYIAFLDSDDEWLPHHLELCLAFLEAFPNESFVSCELLEDFSQGRFVNHYRVETSEWYLGMATRIRSHMLDLPPGETDDYLRVYESREPIGDWGDHIVKRAGRDQNAFLYSGRIFEYLRWGFLIALPATVIKRTALETVGFPDPDYCTASDFHFMANLCQNFRANFLSVPTYIKHEFNSEGRIPVESHIATGAPALTCARDMLRSWEDLFWHARRNDRELCALRSLRQFSIAKIALEFGQRDLALQCLKEARQGLPGFWRAIALAWVVRCLPQPEMSRKAWNALSKGPYACKQVIHGELSLGMFLRKALARLRKPGDVEFRPLG